MILISSPPVIGNPHSCPHLDLSHALPAPSTFHPPPQVTPPGLRMDAPSLLLHSLPSGPWVQVRIVFDFYMDRPINYVKPT